MLPGEKKRNLASLLKIVVNLIAPVYKHIFTQPLLIIQVPLTCGFYLGWLRFVDWDFHHQHSLQLWIPSPQSWHQAMPVHVVPVTQHNTSTTNKKKNTTTTPMLRLYLSQSLHCCIKLDSISFICTILPRQRR
jgi:hypothetical protein